MDRVFVTEKHDVAKAIADVLSGTAKKEGGYECGNDDETWYGCSGFPICQITYSDKGGKPDYK